MRVTRFTFQNSPEEDVRKILRFRWCAACGKTLTVPFVLTELPHHSMGLHVECAQELSHLIFMDAMFDHGQRCCE